MMGPIVRPCELTENERLELGVKSSLTFVTLPCIYAIRGGAV